MDRAKVASTPTPDPERGRHLKKIFARIDEEVFESDEEIGRIRHDLHRDIALRLIEAGQGMGVIMYFNEFQGLDRNDIVLRLIEAGYTVELVYSNIFDNFQFSKRVALKFIEAGADWVVYQNLDKFQDIDKEIVLRLIEAGAARAVVQNLDKFQGLDREIALKLIEAEVGWAVTRHADKFQGLDREIALRLIGEGGDGPVYDRAWEVFTHLKQFPGLDRETVAEILRKYSL